MSVSVSHAQLQPCTVFVEVICKTRWFSPGSGRELEEVIGAESEEEVWLRERTTGGGVQGHLPYRQSAGRPVEIWFGKCVRG